MVDFMSDDSGGLTFAPGDWRELRRRIGQVVKDPRLLETLRASLPKFCIGLDENARRYEEIYHRSLSTRREESPQPRNNTGEHG
jgi:hypothetical protein